MRDADRTVIITGGNSGLGLACARAVLEADQGWRVILAGRSLERSEAVAVELSLITGNRQVEARMLDLASLESIRDFACSIRESPGLPLRALVCNAGVQQVSGTRTTAEGFEVTFGVNHLGHFLLTNLLLTALQRPSRIVFVSSGTHDPARKTGMPAPEFRDPRDLAFPDPEDGESPGAVGRRRYTTSKLCNVLCAYELDRRLRDHGLSTDEAPVDVVAYDPGLMPGTGLARDYGPGMRFVWSRLGPALRPVLRALIGDVESAEGSGLALARLVLEPAGGTAVARYSSVGRVIPSSLESYDEAKAVRLWDGSAELVGLTAAETPLRTSTVTLG